MNNCDVLTNEELVKLKVNAKKKIRLRMFLQELKKMAEKRMPYRTSFLDINLHFLSPIGGWHPQGSPPR